MFNIIICGTPGTGKSTLIDQLKPKLPEFNFINLSEFALANGCTDGYDEQLETHVIDEDKLVDQLEPQLREKKFNLIESIHGDMIPSDLVKRVFVCQADNTILYDRLKARNYSQEKISNNVQSEIFNLIHEEALEQFGDSLVTTLMNNNYEDLERNIEKVVTNVSDLLNYNAQ